jgi:hypothetical protein
LTWSALNGSSIINTNVFITPGESFDKCLSKFLFLFAHVLVIVRNTK